MEDWTTGMFEVSPLGIGIAVAICVVASVTYMLWITISGKRS